jgi:small subunit ribosomal protein S13
MIYLFEAKLSENQSVLFALKKIYGINKHIASLICKKIGFSINLKVKDLIKEQINEILQVIDLLNLLISQDLKKFKLLIVKNAITIQSYKGRRRNLGLPTRGQRTHTNAKTARKKYL